MDDPSIDSPATVAESAMSLVAIRIFDTAAQKKNPADGRAADGIVKEFKRIRLSISESGRMNSRHQGQVQAGIRKGRRGDSFQPGYPHRSARKVA